MNVYQIAKANNINKVCINGYHYDIRGLHRTEFDIVPTSTEIINSIFHEPMLMCWTM